MALREVLHIIRRSWLILVAAVVVALAAGAVVTMLLPDRYQTETKVLVTPVVATGPNANAVQSASLVADQVATYAALVDTSAVIDPAIRQSGVNVTPNDLMGDVTSEVVPQTSLILITVTADSAPHAVGLANALSQNLVQQIHTQASANSPLQAVGTVVETPQTPDHRSSPNLVLNLVAALAVGLVVGFVVIAIRQALTVGAPVRTSGPELRAAGATSSGLPARSTGAPQDARADLPAQPYGEVRPTSPASVVAGAPAVPREA